MTNESLGVRWHLVYKVKGLMDALHALDLNNDRHFEYGYASFFVKEYGGLDG